TGCQIYIDDPPQCSLPVPEPLQLIDPDTGWCVGYDLGVICDPDTCVCSAPAIAPPSWAPCNSACSGLDEYTCMDTAGCRVAREDGVYAGCHATDQTGPIQGACAGLGPWECSRHDDCITSYESGYTAADSPPQPLPPL